MKKYTYGINKFILMLLASNRSSYYYYKKVQDHFLFLTVRFIIPQASNSKQSSAIVIQDDFTRTIQRHECRSKYLLFSL